MTIFNQQEFDIRLEWGLKGVEILAPVSDIVIIIDVLSFSTCVDIGTSLGISIYPYRWKDESATKFAAQMGAVLAGNRGSSQNGYSLSPLSFISAPKSPKVVLASPNGSTLSLSNGNTCTLCGCLRNAEVVARYAMKTANKIAIIPAGEQWPDGSLRSAFEDLVGAGAIISFLQGSLSPESSAALSVFKGCCNIYEQIKLCASGKELIARGFEEDVRFASELNVSRNVPILRDGAYTGLHL